mmetsp:Transcript_3120/g.7385  ORF Transcript_3120/g.7385 Transcript_3120/m.7385 type:complete len:211 (-) Transcript_3120:1149-1781(-)
MGATVDRRPRKICHVRVISWIRISVADKSIADCFPKTDPYLLIKHVFEAWLTCLFGVSRRIPWLVPQVLADCDLALWQEFFVPDFETHPNQVDSRKDYHEKVECGNRVIFCGNCLGCTNSVRAGRIMQDVQPQDPQKCGKARNDNKLDHSLLEGGRNVSFAILGIAKQDQDFPRNDRVHVLVCCSRYSYQSVVFGKPSVEKLFRHNSKHE